MRPFDTSPDTHEFQIAAYRQMTPEQKAELIVEISDAAREVSREGIRMRHPDYSDEDVKRALFVLLHGRKLAEDFFGEGNVPEP
jgi:hypothetical protein